MTVGLFATLITVAFATPASAQTCDQDTKAPIYQEYLDNYAGNLEQRKAAVKAAKEYIKLCKASEPDAEIVAYLEGAIPALEEGIAKEEEANRQAELAKAEAARFARFDKAYKASNWDEVFAAADEFLKYPPVKMDIQLDMRILLASAGSVLAEGKPAINKYNDITLKYAQEAISRINAGETSKTGKWGGYNYSWGTKENALGWLNYAIGYIKYYPQDKKDEAIAYYYKATQFESDTKSYPPIYATLGGWYQSKAAKLGQDRAKIDITEAAGEQQQANIDKALGILAMEKGYAERAIDAYARALKVAKEKKESSAAFKDSLYSTLKALFEFRYSAEEDAAMRSEEKINSFVAGVTASSLPNPMSEVKPVVEKIETGEPADKASEGSTEGSATGTVTTGQRSRTVETTAAKKTGNR